MEISELVEKLSTIDDKEIIYENDTIERFIVPIIKIAGWDIHSVHPLILRRGNRANSSNRRFDLELYSRSNDKFPKFVFECKRLSEQISLIGKGCVKNLKDQKDFVCQLKNDCLSPNFCFSYDLTIPVLTNGEQWVVFTTELANKKRANESISESNYSDFIKMELSITDNDFEGKIINVLKEESAEVSPVGQPGPANFR